MKLEDAQIVHENKPEGRQATEGRMVVLRRRQRCTQDGTEKENSY